MFSGPKMSFDKDKDKNILYTLTNELDDELSEKYSVFENRISK
jgi:hypothetical protein